MTGSQDLSELLERVEGATGADRELDALLHLICDERRIVWWEGNQLFSRRPEEAASNKWLEGWIDPGVAARNWASSDYRHPAYTASLDAALALVERVLPGAMWDLHHTPGAEPVYTANLMPPAPEFAARGPSAPLAVIAALLKALQAQASDTQHGSQS